MDARIDRGMEMVMIKRAAPAAEEQQNQQTGQRAGDHRFAHHPGDGGAHEHRLIAQGLDLAAPAAAMARICGSFSLMLLMMSMVEALPVFSTLISTARRPSSRTMLVCGE